MYRSIFQNDRKTAKRIRNNEAIKIVIDIRISRYFSDNLYEFFSPLINVMKDEIYYIAENYRPCPFNQLFDIRNYPKSGFRIGELTTNRSLNGPSVEQ